MNIRHMAAKIFSGKKTDIGMALVFLGLIIVPSGLLAYFSWHALKNEKLISHERLVRSYNRIAYLAALQIDEQLEKIEAKWLQAIRRATENNDDQAAVQIITRMIAKEPLVVEYYYFTAPGKLIHPQRIESSERTAAQQVSYKSDYAEEFLLFEKAIEHGEDLEYYASDLAGALRVYRRVAEQVKSPQLRGVAKSYIGRVLMKQGNWDAALAHFQELLQNYSELRDLNGMLLTLWAEYQIVVCLESMGRDREAVEKLLQLNTRLLEQSDAINTAQYSNFLDEINGLLPRLLSSPKLQNKAHYRKEFARLAETNKKRISQRFFAAFFHRKLNEAIIERKVNRPSMRYYSGEAANEPYLLGVIFLEEKDRPQIRGLIGLQIDLQALRQKLFPAIIKNLNFSKDAKLTLINKKDEIVIGEAPPGSQPIAMQQLGRPFQFWQVAIFLEEGGKMSPESNLTTSIGLWLISLLLLSILAGAYIFIRRAHREARLSQMKSTFVSSLSHELRTPLASIKMLAELLEIQYEKATSSSLDSLKQRGSEYLQVIRRESERLNRLIDNLLDFSRIERGSKRYNFEYEEVAVVINMALDAIRPQIEANEFAIHTDISPDLPEVRIDADSISQVIINLVSNALKYSAEVKEITIRAYEQEAFVRIAVVDKGIGISAADQQKVFESFYRVDQKLNSVKQGGVGIGLTLVRQIVKDHGGEITIESALGAGSTFTFTLPVAQHFATQKDEAAVEAV